jgi:hypothetical protein
MGLPASQRRILEKIENALRGSDPRLTSLFAIFSRLTRDEEMPRVEQLRAHAELLGIRLQNRLAAVSHGLRTMPPARHRAVLFLPLALLVVASTFIMAAALPSSSKCAPVVAAAGVAASAARHHADGKKCAPPVVIFAR